MLREALINLGLIACLFLGVGGLLYLGTTALVAAPLWSAGGSDAVVIDLRCPDSFGRRAISWAAAVTVAIAITPASVLVRQTSVAKCHERTGWSLLRRASSVARSGLRAGRRTYMWVLL